MIEFWHDFMYKSSTFTGSILFVLTFILLPCFVYHKINKIDK